MKKSHNKASNGEQLFRRFFVEKKTATKKQLQSCRVLAALGINMSTLPNSKSVPKGVDVEKIKKMVARRNLAGLANDTKWDELIESIRSKKEWRPSYRSKSVSGYISGWDTEWHYHLPFPLVGVEWFDISLQATSSEPSTEWIIKLVSEIGFEYEVNKDKLRIWGYGPKSYDEF